MGNPHTSGFEREDRFLDALAECRKVHNNFKAKTLRAALQIACPEFMEGLFDPRPCTRKLRYIGDSTLAENPSAGYPDEFFKVGGIYESIDFNGGTYQIKGYERRIGYVYFEICTQ